MNVPERKKHATPTPATALDAVAAGIGTRAAGEITLHAMTALHHLALERVGNAHVAMPNPVTGEPAPRPSLADHKQALAILSRPALEAWTLAQGDALALDLAGAEILARVRGGDKLLELVRALNSVIDAFYKVAPKAETGAEGPLGPPAAAG